MKKDNIYSSSRDTIKDFVFDDQVAGVFEDMINRSVPGYQNMISGIGVLAGQYVQEDSVCYDLGCSLGASTLMMRRCMDKEDVKIIAVDNSESMVKRCREHIQKQEGVISVEVICDDIENIEIQRASVVVLNFVLQFISLEYREVLLRKIYGGMKKGAVLILSEKIAFDDQQEQNFLTDMHHAFKKQQGYSDLEISQKRSALENVLIPEMLKIHKERLQHVGFNKVHLWFQCFNFVSMAAVKL